jgi:hypothetical protein
MNTLNHEYGEAAGLIALLRGGEDWISTSRIVEAVLPGGAHSAAATVAQWKILAERLPGEHTRLIDAQGNDVEKWGRRIFSRQALVLIGLNGRLPFNDAFRAWAASFIVKAILTPRDARRDEAQALADAVAGTIVGLLTAGSKIDAEA